MDERGRSRWGSVLAVIMTLLIAAGAVWYRLAREGRVPPPGRWLILGAVLLLMCMPFGFMLLYRTLARETEDAAVLRRRVQNDAVLPEPGPDFTRDYPLVFRPEWRGLVMNAGMTIMTVIVAVLQTERMTVRDQVLALLVIASFVAMLVGMLMSRRLTISWPGVTLRELRRERFWSWDEIEAVVLWEQRGRRRPALRLRSLQGEGQLVSLGGIDFADEERLFTALIARVQRLDVQKNGTTFTIRPRAREDIGALLTTLFEQEEEGDFGELTDESQSQSTTGRAGEPDQGHEQGPPMGPHGAHV